VLFNADIDAGESLTLTGPGQTITLSRSAGLYDFAALAMGRFFVPGSWRIEGNGGANIAPFQAELNLPPAARVANRDSLAMFDRAQDQDVLWDPGGYSGTDVATLTLSLSRLDALGLSASQILCRTPASTGALTIPSNLLQTLPPRIGLPPSRHRAPAEPPRSVFSSAHRWIGRASVLRLLLQRNHLHADSLGMNFLFPLQHSSELFNLPRASLRLFRGLNSPKNRISIGSVQRLKKCRGSRISFQRNLKIARHGCSAGRIICSLHRPFFLAFSTAVSPASRISPLAISFSALSRLIFDQTLLPARGNKSLPPELLALGPRLPVDPPAAQGNFNRFLVRHRPLPRVLLREPEPQARAPSMVLLEPRSPGLFDAKSLTGRSGLFVFNLVGRVGPHPRFYRSLPPPPATVVYSIVWNMSKMIQVRDVPRERYSILKARAARDGMSLSDLIKRELKRAAERPSMAEWLERTQQLRPVPAKRTAAQVIRRLRDAR